MRQVWRRQCIPWLTLVAVLMAAPGQAQTATAEQELRAAVEAHVAGYASNTVEGYFERYAHDVTIWWPSGVRFARETYWQQWTKTLADGNLVESAETDDVQVHIAPSGDSGIASFLWRISRAGGNSYVLQTSFTMFKRNGKWEIIHVCFNRDPLADN